MTAHHFISHLTLCDMVPVVKMQAINRAMKTSQDKIPVFGMYHQREADFANMRVEARLPKSK